MEKIKVAIIFGGCSSEYEVSLQSATSIIKNINKDKYNLVLVGITRSGDFYLYNGDVDKIEKDEWASSSDCIKVSISVNRSDKGLITLDEKHELIPVDIVFPVLHGQNGEDGRLQGLLELADIKYVGCDMSSSMIAMDKHLAHTLVGLENIDVPKSFLFDKYNTKEEIYSSVETLSFPVFVKPLRAGSSFGITKVLNRSDLESAIDLAFSYDEKIVIEEGIDGFEVGCAVLGNNSLTIGEVDEIELQEGFFDYTEKYTLKTSKIHLPARLSEDEREAIKKTALKIYKVLHCSGFARVDMFYTKDKRIVFNEVNTIPGCTQHSRYPSMLKQVGYSFEEIIDKLIELGLNR